MQSYLMCVHECPAFSGDHACSAMHRHGFPFLWDIEGVAGLKTEIVFWLTFSCYTVILSCATTPRVDDKQHRDKGLGEALPPSVSVHAPMPYHSTLIICCFELQLAC